MSGSEKPYVGEVWRFKKNRGHGTFRVTQVSRDYVTLRGAMGNHKRISLRTLRGDYERKP